MKRILLVYFSRTGATERLVTDIASRCDITLERIEAVNPRTGPLGSLLTRIDGMFKRSPAIRPVTNHPAQFDLVILGSPNWFGEVAAPMRTYLKQHAGSFPDVAFASTCSGLTPEHPTVAVEAITGRKLVASLIVQQAELDPSTELPQEAERIRKAYGEKVQEFVESLT
jgi:flavodoxin